MLRVAWVAGEQIGADQLASCGVARATVGRWREAGRLHVVHAGVYAVGHPSLPVEGKLVAALLHAGPGAALSHATAAWWWGLLAEAPDQIHVSAPGHARCTEGVSVHHPRELEPVRERRLLVTSVPRTLLDIAATVPYADLRLALANADYRRLLTLSEVRAQVGSGRPGSAALRRAIEHHQPRLALTRSRLERELLALCETYDIPLPEVNVKLNGWRVDALWREAKVIVEVDGGGNHSTPAQMARDRRMDMALRAAGFIVLRYSYDQATAKAHEVAGEINAMLSPTAPSAARGSR